MTKYTKKEPYYTPKKYSKKNLPAKSYEENKERLQKKRI